MIGSETAEAIMLSTPAMQVELPLGATEDRICGTINIEKALQEGVKAYEPGLLVSVILHIPLAIKPCPRIWSSTSDVCSGPGKRLGKHRGMW